MQQREDLALVPLDQFAVGPLVLVGAAVFHAVTLFEALDLAVTKHWQAGQRRHQRADAKVFVALGELVDRGALIGIAHEVDVALEDLGVELQRVLDHGAVVRVLLVAQHVHECAVVDAMHAECAHEIAFHQPERLGEQQRVGRFDGGAIDDLTPEFVRHDAIELGLGQAVFGARWNRPP